MFQSGISITSLIISIIIFAVALLFQLHYFNGNRKKLEIVRNFFTKKRDYELHGEAEDSQLNPYVAEEGSSLHTLIKELNEYTKKNHGTTDFSVIQNKTDRKINVLYEDATSKIAFPTYIGLMGTFIGVFLGLLFFTIDLASSSNGEGITDETIGNLITGVLVSMSTSFVGLLLTTFTHHLAADTQKVVGEDKNNFYEFIQNELMPTLGVSMVAALNKLHHTINLFEPSFNNVIERFQATFDSCTQRFGSAFEQNVTIISEAVRVMGENMDKINENVDLNEQLIHTMQSEDIQRTLGVFIDASFSYGLIVDRTRKFEEIASLLENRLLELINTQRRYNESLELPLNVANKLNQILCRVTDFEKSINALGRNIERTDLLGNAEIEALKQAITAIKKKQKIAIEAMEVSDGHLENIFKMQSEAIVKLGRTYEESFATYAEKFQNILDGLEKEMLERRREIVTAIEEKFSLDQIQKEFSQLSKLKKIEELLASINTKSSRAEVDETLDTTRREVESIRKLLDKAIEEAKKKPESGSTGGAGGFLGGLFGGRK